MGGLWGYEGVWGVMGGMGYWGYPPGSSGGSSRGSCGSILGRLGVDIGASQNDLARFWIVSGSTEAVPLGTVATETVASKSESAAIEADAAAAAEAHGSRRGSRTSSVLGDSRPMLQRFTMNRG